MRYTKMKRRRRLRGQFLALIALLVALITILSVRAVQAPRKSVAGNALLTETVKPLRHPALPAPEEQTGSRYSSIEISEVDIYALACLVYHEARGESLEGQIAVVEVVLNRCLSEHFPNTVNEVVFQKYGDVWQFSPVPYLWTANPSETQFEAVNTALTETGYILSAETVYFSGTPYNDSVYKVIENHYFCEID